MDIKMPQFRVCIRNWGIFYRKAQMQFYRTEEGFFSHSEKQSSRLSADS